MNIFNLLSDIHTLLKTNTSADAEFTASPSMVVYREENTPNDPDRKLGYLVWSFDVEEIHHCSNGQTGVVEGLLDTAILTTKTSTREKRCTSLLDILTPVNANGDRETIAPVALTSCFLQALKLVNIQEVYTEKTGQPIPETSGIIYTWHLKARITE